jgi:hypothetical protein
VEVTSCQKFFFFRMEEGEFKVKINKRVRCFGMQKVWGLICRASVAEQVMSRGLGTRD